MHNLSSLHTFGVAASSDRLLSLQSFDDLNPLTEAIQLGQPWLVLGGGSNCVFTQDFLGVVATNQLKGININELTDGYKLTVASGENWHDLVVFCLQQGIFGFENLALIPGTVGAAPIQNIGAYGRELNEFVDSIDYVDLLTGTSHSIAAANCQFGYRDSIFKHSSAKHWFITQVHFWLPKANRLETSYGELASLATPSPQAIFDTVCAVRQRKLPDPKVLGNAGSFFKNPVIDDRQFASLQQQWPSIPFYRVDDNAIKIPAAWLIDQCGFKGASIGGVRCHPNQPLVLTNMGSATGAELLTMARSIRDKVISVFSIELENEVRLIGEKGMIVL